MNVQFLGWQEADPRKDLTRRIAESCERFAARYGRPATILRVNPRTVLPATLALPVEPSRQVPVGQVWPGGGSECGGRHRPRPGWGAAARPGGPPMKLLPWHKLGVGWGAVLGLEGLGWGLNAGAGHLLTGEQAAQLGSRLPWLGLLGSLSAGGPPVLLGLATAGLGLGYYGWRQRVMPAARQARQQPGVVLELRVPAESATPRGAFAAVLEQVYTLLQADVRAVQRGEALTVAWEIWSRPEGTRLYSWLPGATPWPTVTALADLIRAGYPGSRVLVSPDPLISYLDPPEGAGPAALVGLQTFRLQSDALYPIRDGADFQTDALAGLIAACTADGATPLVGLQIVTTAYNGTFQADVRGRARSAPSAAGRD